METIYNLTDRETEFLKALAEKPTHKNMWSGRASDDAFIAKWDKEIRIFGDAGLTEKKDGGHYDEYWCYGLNAKGLKLQKKYL